MSQNKCIRFCLKLDKRSKIRVKEFLQLSWLNFHDRYLQFIVSDIFKFQNDQCPDYFDELFCPVGENGVITRSSNKKLKLPFRKTKLWIQSLSYAGRNTWTSLSDNLKSATSVNSFKHYIKEYFLKKLGTLKQKFIVNLSRYDNEVCNFLEFMQNRTSTVFTFFIVSISRFFSMLSIFPLRDF